MLLPPLLAPQVASDNQVQMQWLAAEKEAVKSAASVRAELEVQQMQVRLAAAFKRALLPQHGCVVLVWV